MDLSTEKVWKDFSSGLRSFIGHRVSNYSQEDDILQDIFVKIHRNISTVSNETKLRSWVYQIARNTIIDHYRKNKTKTEELDIERLEDNEEEFLKIGNECSGEGNSYESPSAEIAAGLREMVGQLPEKYAEALLLVEFNGLTQPELAEKLGISVSGAKSRVQRGRQMLKDALMRCCHFEFDRYGTIIDFYPHCCCCCECT